MWPDLIRKAKAGGLNVIQTYVFWNIHEPVEGTFDFEGNRDLLKFIRLVGENKMYVTLRLGPFIQAEWNHGGLPYWLREVQNISFRNDNAAFKVNYLIRAEFWNSRVSYCFLLGFSALHGKIRKEDYRYGEGSAVVCRPRWTHRSSTGLSNFTWSLNSPANRTPS